MIVCILKHFPTGKSWEYFPSYLSVGKCFNIHTIMNDFVNILEKYWQQNIPRGYTKAFPNWEILGRVRQIFFPSAYLRNIFDIIQKTHYFMLKNMWFARFLGSDVLHKVRSARILRVLKAQATRFFRFLKII